jgi:hypothetical protein
MEEKELTADDLIQFGFIPSDNGFSKLVNPKTVPPFYINIQPAEYNDTDWRVLNKYGLVSIIKDASQLKFAILVICHFDEKCLNANFNMENVPTFTISQN